ncbi:hypothetical protein HDU86_005036 [Geranomyces michiganensis]|nr:hypothetical protein HDU86_005036 [Geranomyces michiganensis]
MSQKRSSAKSPRRKQPTTTKQWNENNLPLSALHGAVAGDALAPSLSGSSATVPISTSVLALLKSQLADLTSRARTQAAIISALEADLAASRAENTRSKTNAESTLSAARLRIAELENRVRDLERRDVEHAASTISTTSLLGQQQRIRDLELQLYRTQLALQKAEIAAAATQARASSEHEAHVRALQQNFDHVTRTWDVRGLQHSGQVNVMGVAKGADPASTQLQKSVMQLLDRLRGSLNGATQLQHGTRRGGKDKARDENAYDDVYSSSGEESASGFVRS